MEGYESQIAPFFPLTAKGGRLGWWYCCLRSCVGGQNTFGYLEVWVFFLWDLKWLQKNESTFLAVLYFFFSSPVVKVSC